MSSEASEAGDRTGADLDVRLLGPIQVVGADGALRALGSRKQRALLTILVLARGQVVSADRLVDELWGDEPPAQALGSLYPYISNLRRLLEPRREAPPSLLVTVPPGYALRLEPDAVDAVRFERAAGEVSTLLADGAWAQARARATAALALWRGPALGEFAFERYAELDARRLDELRLAMLEDSFEARLAQHDGQLVADVEHFVGEQPLRERAWALLMRALYAAGRQSDALRAYQRVRSHLLDELGVEPGPQLSELEQAILRHDDDLPVPRHDPATDALRRPATITTPETATPADDDPAMSGQLVGRAAELALVLGVLDELQRGPRAVVIEGEPGIGKTRLAEELADVAARRGALVLWGRSFEGAAAPALWPWLPALRTLGGLVPRDAPAAEEVARLVSASAGDAGTTGPNRFLLFDAIGRLVEDVARDREIMIVLDDVQWADVASLELVMTLATRLSAPGILLVATTREPDVGRNDVLVAALATLARMTGSRRIKLDGLSAIETAELLRAVAGVAVGAVTAAATHQRADGNPFFITELARLLAGPSATATADDVPAGVRDVVRRRLQPLTEPTVELLQVAAVVGREFELDVLARASARELLDCLEALEPAVLQRLVVHIDDRPGTYRFIHALVREVLVDDLSPLQLAIEHLRVADAVDDDGDDTAELVAEHLWAAQSVGVGHRAAETLERAAHVAIRRVAYESAQDLLERAAHLYRAVGDDGQADPDGELRCLALMASVTVAHGGYIAANDSPIMARARQVDARDPDDVSHMLLEVFEYFGRLVACDLDVADRMAPRLLGIAETTTHPLVRSLGHSAYAGNCWYHGRFAEAVVHYDHARVAAGAALPRLAETPVNPAQLHMGEPIRMHLHEMMGELEDPTLRTEECRGVVPGDPLWNLSVTTFAALGALMVGDAERAAREARIGIAVDPDHAFGPWSTAPRACLRAAQWLLGSAPDGPASVVAELDAYVPGTQITSMSIILANIAIGLAGAGHVAEAAEIAGRARRELGEHRDLYTEPVVLLAEAAVHAARGDGTDSVTRLLNQALVVAERQGALAVATRVRATAATLGLRAWASPEAH